MGKLALALCVLAGLAGACGHPAQSSTLANQTSGPAADARLVGTWRETWGTPGATDVAYHDEYQVLLDHGQATVVPVSDHSDRIDSVTIHGDDLELVIHTSFDVRYQLHLAADGASMSGTATTPDKTVPIRWERITP